MEGDRSEMARMRDFGLWVGLWMGCIEVLFVGDEDGDRVGLVGEERLCLVGMLSWGIEVC